jgi:hypothetical protein
VAGSIAVTTSDKGSNVTLYSAAWASDAAGAVSGTVTATLMEADR